MVKKLMFWHIWLKTYF